MKIRLTEWFSEWRHAKPQRLDPVVLDLREEKAPFYLVVSLGNGSFDQACFEHDSLDAYRFVVDLLGGTGGATRVQPEGSCVQSVLYRTGYEVYQQGQDAYFFVDPQPRPELFVTEDAAS